MLAKQEWFEVWFDSPYYHILYDHRNEQEAENFILNLKNHFQFSGKENVLDLACGAGRHAAFIAKFVKEVVGLDLSENSIQQAKKTYPANNLEFYSHDMRLPFRMNYFNYIFNFFTSFGYFQTVSDNLKVLQSVHKGLKQNGILVLDFMNAQYTIKNLVKEETIVKQGISFHIKREVKNRKILKHISFSDKGKNYQFTESVQALFPADFMELLLKAGFVLINEFGNYSLEPFQLKHSNRYIVIAKKK